MLNPSFETQKLVLMSSSKPSLSFTGKILEEKLNFSSQQVKKEEEEIPIGGPLMVFQF